MEWESKVLVSRQACKFHAHTDIYSISISYRPVSITCPRSKIFRVASVTDLSPIAEITRACLAPDEKPGKHMYNVFPLIWNIWYRI